MTITFGRTIPVLRIFSEEKAKEFYVGFLGFEIEWQHRFEADAPLFMQVRRAGLFLRLSEHHGDACPGALITIELTGVDALHREISAKSYPYMRPGLEETPWGAREVTVIDPFGNRLNFSEPAQATLAAASCPQAEAAP